MVIWKLIANDALVKQRRDINEQPNLRNNVASHCYKKTPIVPRQTKGTIVLLVAFEYCTNSLSGYMHSDADTSTRRPTQALELLS